MELRRENILCDIIYKTRTCILEINGEVLYLPSPGCPLITEIPQWIERYSVMAGLLCKRFPHKAPELFVYLASTVYVERCYESGRWLAYDRKFQREAPG